MTDQLRKALNKAFCLGETYWQQADSESYSQNAKSNDTRAKFDQLVNDECAALASIEAQKDQHFQQALANGAKANALATALERCITDAPGSQGVGAPHRVGVINKIACDALRAAGYSTSTGKPIAAAPPNTAQAGKWVPLEPPSKVLFAMHAALEQLTGTAVHQSMLPVYKAALAPAPPQAEPPTQEQLDQRYDEIAGRAKP